MRQLCTEIGRGDYEEEEKMMLWKREKRESRRWRWRWRWRCNPAGKWWLVVHEKEAEIKCSRRY